MTTFDLQNILGHTLLKQVLESPPPQFFSITQKPTLHALVMMVVMVLSKAIGVIKGLVLHRAISKIETLFCH